MIDIIIIASITIFIIYLLILTIEIIWIRARLKTESQARKQFARVIRMRFANLQDQIEAKQDKSE